MLADGQRNGRSQHPPEERAPDPGADDGLWRFDGSAIRLHTVELAGPDIEPDDACPRNERDTRCRGPIQQRADGSERLGDPVDRHVVRAEELADVQEREQRTGVVGRDDPRAGHAPRLGDTELAAMIGPALRRPRDLDGSDREEARLVRGAERREEVDSLEGQPGHRPRVARREDAARRVGGRAARRRDRSRVDHHDVGPTAVDEVIRDARSDDAGADDHERG